MEIPEIKLEDDCITIKVTIDQLIFLAENNPDNQYKVTDRLKFAEGFKHSLENMDNTNGSEGLSALQCLFDEAIDDAFIMGEGIVDLDDEEEAEDDED